MKRVYFSMAVLSLVNIVFMAMGFEITIRSETIGLIVFTVMGIFSKN